jgi:hypothetical protein
MILGKKHNSKWAAKDLTNTKDKGGFNPFGKHDFTNPFEPITNPTLTLTLTAQLPMLPPAVQQPFRHTMAMIILIPFQFLAV